MPANLAAELLQARTDTESVMMPESGTLTHKGAASVDAYGNTVYGADTTETVNCALARDSGSQMDAAAGRELEKNWYMLTVPATVAIVPDDTIVIGGDTYSVMRLWDDHSFRVARRAVVVKVD